MKRRWKVGMALAVVGLAGFLVWAFLYAPNPSVTIRFMGYETSAPPLKVTDISARFCVANGSGHDIYWETISDIPVCRVETKTSEGWLRKYSTYPEGTLTNSAICLPPGGQTNFTLSVLSLNRPLRVTLPYSTNHWSRYLGRHGFIRPKPAVPSILTKIKTRISRWLRLSPEQTSVSITIQE